MAFSLRKMLSNITYFKKPGGECTGEENINTHCQMASSHETSSTISFERTEPDSTSKQCATSLKLPNSVKNYASKKAFLSDTDVQTVSVEIPAKKERKRSKKLKLDIEKVNQSSEFHSDSSNIENTPKHMLLDCKSEDLFSQRFKGFDFNRSFDLFDAMSDDTCNEDNADIESLSEHSDDTDISLVSDMGKETIKMCRKVDGDSDPIEENLLVPSATPESFGDVELEKNEEQRMELLSDYQTKLEKLEGFLKKVLSEFQFHIDVSKVFLCKSITEIPSANVEKIPKLMGKALDIRGDSPADSWNIVTDKEDADIKFKVKNQLLSMRHYIDEFIDEFLSREPEIKKMQRCKSITNNLNNKLCKKRLSYKKKFKHYDFPDLREAMLNLFEPDSRDDSSISGNNITALLSDSDLETPKCICRCHNHSPKSESDSGLTTKNESLSSQSITSSLGNFTLDTSTLTAYSESLDQIISYNSFDDTSLYGTLLQKAAIERITFYVQVHSIQLKCETDQDVESKSSITFHCPSCKIVETEENGLLRHILSQNHCEKIHFLYKTAYIKKCMSSGKEIMPSTVLNPMTLYRDDNKIVCFGDALYACSLCFENLIIGESVLMAHCSEPEHVDRRERLSDVLD